MSARRYSSDKTRGQNVRCHRSGLLASKKADFKKHPFGRCGCHDIPHGYPAPFISPTELKTPCNPGCCNLLWQRYSLGMGCLNDDKWWSMWAWSLRYFSYHEFRSSNCVFGTRVAHVFFLSHCLITSVGTVIVATIYLQLIQNRYMFRSFTVLQCSHQHCVQPVASDVEVVGYL